LPLGNQLLLEVVELVEVWCPPLPN
jgi:hypothetical protein